MSVQDAASTARGDFQTPVALAREVWQLLPQVDVVVEPTVGTGAFLEAAPIEARRLTWRCFDLQLEHVMTSRDTARRLGFDDAAILQRDAFGLSPVDFLDLAPDARVLAVGNPPWVTNAAQGAAGQTNLPEKRNRFGLQGLDALTGRANFDIAEAVLLALLDALRDQPEVHLAFLLKRSAAIRLSRQLLGRPGFSDFSFAHIDARRHFGVGVEAGLLQFRRTLGEYRTEHIALSTHLGAPVSTHAGLAGGQFVEDLRAYEHVSYLESQGSDVEWRQGLKHDLARVLELRRRADGSLLNGNGDRVDIEDDALHPFWKGADIAGQRGASRLFPLYQESLAGPVKDLETRWPKLVDYLDCHRPAFSARKSKIYCGKGPFALFGVGDYLHAPYKVAVSGLHRPARFRVLGPYDGRPSLVDDTSYLLPFANERLAAVTCGFLNSEPVETFLASLVDRFAKRPYTKAVLQRVRLPHLQEVPAALADDLAESTRSGTVVSTRSLVTWLRAWEDGSIAREPRARRLFAA